MAPCASRCQVGLFCGGGTWFTFGDTCILCQAQQPESSAPYPPIHSPRLSPVGVHACRRGAVAPGKKVAIMGAGPIGLVTLLAAKAFGADAVAITDLKPANLEMARQVIHLYIHLCSALSVGGGVLCACWI